MAKNEQSLQDSLERTHHSVVTMKRCLTDDEKDKLNRDVNLVSEFKQNKLEQDARKNWDLFYKRNSTKFFKDRHWTTREFRELCDKKTDGSCQVILEVGCGVGNFVFPLLQEESQLFVYACDFSPRAVQFVKDNDLYDESRCQAFQCDLTIDSLTEHVQRPVDIVTMIFVLSAIHPDKMVDAIRNISQVLSPGGCVLLRDYGLYDHAMLRFAPGHKLGESFYVRQDGTRAYYFSTDILTKLFTNAGLTTVSCDYVQRETINRKEGVCVPRIFVQAKFLKPS